MTEDACQSKKAQPQYADPPNPRYSIPTHLRGKSAMFVVQWLRRASRDYPGILANCWVTFGYESPLFLAVAIHMNFGVEPCRIIESACFDEREVPSQDWLKFEDGVISSL
jgi:hypothetical protein